MFVYLDNSATTKQYGEVTAEMLRFMENEFGNPSSLHNMGMAAENALKNARNIIAEATGFGRDGIFFTSGGTESANAALFGAALARKRYGKKIITSRVEHPAVLESCKKLETMGFEVIYIGVDEKGRLNTGELLQSIDEETVLISVMCVNNEVGTIMPIDELCKIKRGGALFHTDAVQAFGKLPIGNTGADIVTVSAHKIHGPKGCGAVCAEKGIKLDPMILGGGQEKNRRSGTENVAAIAGFGKAVEIALAHMDERTAAMARARNYLLDGIKAEIKDIKINSLEEIAFALDGGYCCPSVLNVSFLGTRGEVLLHGLESEKIYVSTGSACSSNKKGKSHVLSAMGLSDKEIEGAVRFSFSEFNTADEMDFVLCKLKEHIGRFRKLGSFR